MRKLASIRSISAINPIENSTGLERATVLGWQVVVKKGEFKAGDLCIYFEVDSVLPKIEEFAFMEKHKYILKTIRMRGQLSQGLCYPLSLLSKYDIDESTLVDGLDVTDVLGVTKHEVEIPSAMVGISKGYHPKYVRKTGEVRVQSDPRLLEEFQGLDVSVTTKIEGYSASYIRKGGEIDVCSHTHSILESPDSVQWQMAEKYGLIDILNRYDNLAIQGEIAGHGILGNPMGLPDKRFFVFRVTDITTGRRYNPFELIDFCCTNHLVNVPMQLVKNFNYTMDEVLELAKGEYAPSGYPREGIVIVPNELTYSETLCDWLSMKVINNDYLLGEWKKNRNGK